MANITHNCPITTKISEAETTIVGLSNRVKGLEDLLDNRSLPDDKRTSIETELMEIRDILDKNKDILKTLHKENTKSFAIAACLIFLCFLIYGIYCMVVYGRK